jgi:putative transposase
METHMHYEYRLMTPEQREIVLNLRAAKGFPLHAPPHPLTERTYYLLTAVNFEHKHIMSSAERRPNIRNLSWKSSVKPKSKLTRG